MLKHALASICLIALAACGQSTSPGDAAPQTDQVTAAPAAPAMASAAPQVIRLVCNIQFCTNVYYPDRCNVATRRYAIDLDHNTITRANGEASVIQQTEYVVSWNDVYEYLGAPVSEVPFTLDRSTLDIRAETPGNTSGRCAMDQRQF